MSYCIAKALQPITRANNAAVEPFSKNREQQLSSTYIYYTKINFLLISIFISENIEGILNDSFLS